MNFKKFLVILAMLLIFSGCKTIKKKSDEVTEKENQKYGQLVGKEIGIVKKELGNPDEDFINQIGNKVLIYKTKKYGIPCERKFELDESNVIISFTSSGCL
tara:strand:- start:168 stop:470 length:303 start_codon:yes stop_codon:yes gene_type:complete